MTTKNTTAPKITEQQREQLRGLAGFILHMLAEGNENVTASYILGNLGHDIGGLLAQIAGESGAQLFSPRTKSYAKYAGDEQPADFEADTNPTKSKRGKRRAAPAVRFMLVDASLDWVQYKPGKEGRKAFAEFHGGRKPRAGFKVFMCHPGTNWDGAGGYSIPANEWAPVQVL